MKFKADKGALKKIDLKKSGSEALKTISDKLLEDVRGGNFSRFDSVSVKY